MSDDINYKDLLAFQRAKLLSFSEFIDRFTDDPDKYLTSSASLILDAIKHFGYEIIVRSGEPVLRYKIFHDLFANGLNAVYGQEFCIKRIIDVLESVDKEAGPKRGLVLVGPPASGKTNIVDLLSQALEEYTKVGKVKLYSFIFRLTNESGRELELRSCLMPNPILLFPLTLRLSNGEVVKPRQELFEQIEKKLGKKLNIPTYYKHATLDKRTLSILEALLQNPRNYGKTLFDIIEEYVCIEEVNFSNAQGVGISNIDEMSALKSYTRPFTLAHEDLSLLNEHMQGKFMFKYEGPMLSSNRGLLHIHDAFGLQGGAHPSEHEYKPLLMLLGSGKVSVEGTQATIDNTVILTTNLEEMDGLETQLSSSKLLDRIEKVPVNYLLDCNSEMDILRRDMMVIAEKYDIDPNLYRITSFFSVITRLLAPNTDSLPKEWSNSKKNFYKEITPEQKLFIYAYQSEDPVATIRKLPPWHPFRNQCFRLGINIFNPETLKEHIYRHPECISLEDSTLFTSTELKHIDDDFMRQLCSEHYPEEGKYGLSIRQLQNIMRNTIVNSDGLKVTVSTFLAQLEKFMNEGPAVHHWLAMSHPEKEDKKDIASRTVGECSFCDNEGGYGDYKGLIRVVRALYFTLIKKEITVATVDRDPQKIELDLRRYLQHALLDKSLENKAFSHILVPRYTHIDPESGHKVDKPDTDFMRSIEKILDPKKSCLEIRKNIVNKFFMLTDKGDINIDEGRTLITSSDDNLLNAFASEYTTLLSHRRAMEGINANDLRNAFFHKIHDPERYSSYGDELKNFLETIIKNMVNRYHYSPAVALDTIIYALRKNIIDFAKIIS